MNEESTQTKIKIGIALYVKDGVITINDLNEFSYDLIEAVNLILGK